jgi:Raf kinase inhibitor-like YbhB/YbcL family protein
MTRYIAKFSPMAAFCFSAILLAQTAPTVQAKQAAPQPKQGFTLTSASFEDGGIIPNKYTKAMDPAVPVSPALAWANVPNGTVNFVLKMHDLDSALKRRNDEVVHWLMFNIPGASRELPEATPVEAQLPDGSIQIMNEFKAPGYGGPGAAAAGPYHHYTFELYALDTRLELGPDATEANVDSAMQTHILAKAVVVGRFHRP